MLDKVRGKRNSHRRENTFSQQTHKEMFRIVSDQERRANQDWKYHEIQKTWNTI